MLPAPLDYEAPDTLADAVASLAADPAAVVLGASPRTVIDLKMRRSAPSRLVDLRRIAELRGIAPDGDGLRIGSMTTLRAVMDDDATRSGYAGLAAAAELAGDAQMRNMETLLGCLTRDLATSGVAAALLALGATVELAGPRGARTIPLDEFLAVSPAGTSGSGEIVTAVTLAVAPGPSAYEQIRHPATLDPICGVAVCLDLDTTGVVERCAFAVAGATEWPTRLGRAETALTGGPMTDERVRSAAAFAADGLDLASDPFASGEYRAQLVAVLLRRALTTIASRVGSGVTAPG